MVVTPDDPRGRSGDRHSVGNTTPTRQRRRRTRSPVRRVVQGIVPLGPAGRPRKHPPVKRVTGPGRQETEDRKPPKRPGRLTSRKGSRGRGSGRVVPVRQGRPWDHLHTSQCSQPNPSSPGRAGTVPESSLGQTGVPTSGRSTATRGPGTPGRQVCLWSGPPCRSVCSWGGP